jgi:hypothetical protein
LRIQALRPHRQPFTAKLRLNRRANWLERRSRQRLRNRPMAAAGRVEFVTG